MKLEEIETALKRYGFDSSDPLLVWINAAYHEIEQAHKKWSFLEAEEEVKVASGSRRFSLSSPVKRFIRVRDVTAELSTGGEGLDLTYMDRRTMEREFPNLLVKGLPEYFTIVGGNEIQLYPVPSSDRTILSTYIKALADLAVAGEEPLIPVANHYTIVRGSAYIGLQAENEEERAASAQAQFESDLDKMINSDLNPQVGEMATVEDTAGYNE